ncbi:MAG: hypothetical protein IJ231_06440 [Clostridia bacterium]|nr:hypothetical protein [Clostridia bacterium]
MNFLAWLLSLIFAFSLGAESAKTPAETDDALRNRVQEHIDVIVDESAAIVDEVTTEIRKDERVQDAEQFVQDVQDVADETLKDLNQVVEDTKTRVEEKFGKPADTSEPQTEDAAETECPPKTEPEETDPAQPGPEDSVNG